MGRKKREPIELVEESLDELAAESRASETEVEDLEEELELLDADDEEKEEITVTEALTSDEEDTVVTEKPKRKRAPRRKKVKAEVEAEAEAEETVLEAQSEEAPPVETPSREEAEAPVSPAFDPSHDAVRQWELIKQMSEAICASLERTSLQIKDMPSQVAAAFQENFRAPVARPAPITKVAVLAAGFALVLSALSLSFAQSARQTVLAKDVYAASATREKREEPTKPALPPVKVLPPVASATPPSIANEIARAERAEAPRPRPQASAPRPSHVVANAPAPAKPLASVSKKHLAAKSRR